MKRQTRRIVAAGTIGNVLEWYDFSIYGYFAATIGAHLLPDRAIPSPQVLAAFSVFAVGYLMRPLGGIVVGHIGDRFGRRAALTFSMMAMAVPTFLVGLLPGYEALGVAAPILLTLLRMIQGLAVGGEATIAIVFLIERAARPAWRARGAGLLRRQPRHAVGIGRRRAAGGGDAGGDARRLGLAHPVRAGPAGGRRGLFPAAPHRRNAARRDRPARDCRWSRPCATTGGWCVRLAGLACFNAIGFYLVFLYAVSWLQTVDGIAPARALGFNTASMLLLLPLMFGMGWLSDRIGRKKLLLAATAAGFVGALPLFWLMHHPQPAMILLGEAGFVLILARCSASCPRPWSRRRPRASAAPRFRSATTSPSGSWAA